MKWGQKEANLQARKKSKVTSKTIWMSGDLGMHTHWHQSCPSSDAIKRIRLFIFSQHLNVLLLLSVCLGEIQARPNTNAILPCNVTFPDSAKRDQMDHPPLNISWMSDGSEEGFSWDATQLVSGDFSLTVLRSSLECTVHYNSKIPHSSNVTFGMSLLSCWDLCLHLRVSHMSN